MIIGREIETPFSLAESISGFGKCCNWCSIQSKRRFTSILNNQSLRNKNTTLNGGILHFAELLKKFFQTVSILLNDFIKKLNSCLISFPIFAPHYIFICCIFYVLNENFQNAEVL